MKVIIGAGGTSQPGWLALEHSDLDVTDSKRWAELFAPSSLDAILAEHVFEHLTERQAFIALLNCWRYLKHGGYLRIAVPDGLHPNANYLEWVRPGGSGERFLQLFRTPEDAGHQVIYNYRTLCDVLMRAGFHVRLLEWFDGRGKLNRSDWSQADGHLLRCFSSPYTTWVLNPMVGAKYTSLIVDAFKE